MATTVIITIDESDIGQDQDQDNSLEELQKEYETIVESLAACIKGLKTLRKDVAAATKETTTTTTAATTATVPIRIRKGTVTKSLNKVLDKAEHDAAVAGTSYGTAVLEALEGAVLEE